MEGAVALLGRTSERDDTAEGARELGELLGARMVGEVEPPRVARWDEDLPAAEPMLCAAREEVEAGTRVFVAGHCNLAIATLPTLDEALLALPDLIGIEVTGCASGHAARVADTLAKL